jgi:CPA2 family monovalent cation:H+ antiporter-2
MQLGLLLGQAGEFAFVLLSLARDGAVLAAPTADYMLMVTALSIFATPIVAAAAMRLFPDTVRVEPLKQPEVTPGHVIIVGFGRVGQGMAGLLDAQQISFIALDSKPERIAALRAQNKDVHFGDASRVEVMRSLHAGEAAAVVIAIDRPHEVEAIVRMIKATWPHVPVFARARDTAHASALYRAGATIATPEAIEATLDLGEAVLEGIGIPRDAARRFIEERRAEERAKALAAR